MSWHTRYPRPQMRRDSFLPLLDGWKLNGNPIVMPDFPHGKIYVKFFDMNTGTASVVEFTAPQPEKKPAPQYATMDDLAQLREEIAAIRRSHESEQEANA